MKSAKTIKLTRIPLVFNLNDPSSATHLPHLCNQPAPCVSAFARAAPSQNLRCTLTNPLCAI